MMTSFAFMLKNSVPTEKFYLCIILFYRITGP